MHLSIQCSIHLLNEYIVKNCNMQCPMMCAAHTPAVQTMSSPCPVHVQSMSSSCPVHVQSMSSPCPVHVQSMSSSCPVHVQSMSSPYPVHVQSMSSSCPVHVQSMSSSCGGHQRQSKKRLPGEEGPPWEARSLVASLTWRYLVLFFTPSPLSLMSNSSPSDHC